MGEEKIRVSEELEDGLRNCADILRKRTPGVRGTREFERTHEDLRREFGER